MAAVLQTPSPPNGIISWRLRHNRKCLLATLCLAAIVQGMIFTNVVISSIEKRFGWASTHSGIIAGSYDIGSLLAVIPVTYYGGQKLASKPKYIGAGMFCISIAACVFASPHFITSRYIDTDAFKTTHNVSSSVDDSNFAILEEFEYLNTCHNDSTTTISPYSSQHHSECPNSIENIEKSSSLQPKQSLENFKFVFILGQLLFGIGGSALITLGTTLLDESVPQKVAPVFIGIFNASFVLGPALGYVIGGQFLNIFTEFYLNTSTYNDLTPTNPKWVGAWWLGFILIFVLSMICGLMICIFPAKLCDNNADDENDSKNEKQNVSEQQQDNNENVLNTNKLDIGKLQDIPKALLRLVKNATWMCITFGGTMDGFILAGQAAFLPKYLEFQFRLTSAQAAMTVGSIIVPAGAGGTFLGAYSLKKFNLDRNGAIKFYLLSQSLIMPLYLGFMLNCPTPNIVGLTTSPPHNFGDSNVIQLNSSCNAGCDCISPLAIGRSYEAFVCDEVNELTYLSGCHAGCQNMNKNDNTFTQCTCAQNESTVLKTGLCDSQCNHIYLSVMIFFQVFFTFMGTMPGLVSGLRSVEPQERSLSLGFQTLIARSIGTVPGPIVFGYIIDQTCLLWSQNKDCSMGSCRLYDNIAMSYIVLAVLLTWKLMSLIFFSLALFFGRKSKKCQPELK